MNKKQIAKLFLKIKIDIKIRHVDDFTTLLKAIYINK
jgi:hypothetical protein